MINLLSTHKKADIKAARNNTILLRYIGVLIGALLFIGGILYISYESLKTSEASADAQISLSLSSSGNTSSAQIQAALNQKIHISQIIASIGSALPPATTLNSISVTDGTSVSLILHTGPTTTASAVRNSLTSVNNLSDVMVGAFKPLSSSLDYTQQVEVTAVATGRGY